MLAASTSNASVASLGTLPASASQRDKYGRLVEDLVILGITKHLGISPGSLQVRKQLTEGPVLERTRAGLSEEFEVLLRGTHEAWRQRTRQARVGAGPRAFQMLEADLWGSVASLDGVSARLPVTTPSFAAARLGAGGDEGGGVVPSGTLICEITSASDPSCLEVKLCKLERLLEYAHHDREMDQEHGGGGAGVGVGVIAALATEAAPDGTAERLGEFVGSNATALPRLNAGMASGWLLFVNIPGRTTCHDAPSGELAIVSGAVCLSSTNHCTYIHAEHAESIAVTVVQYIAQLHEDIGLLTESQDQLRTIVEQMDRQAEQERRQAEQERRQAQQERRHMEETLNTLMARLSALEAGVGQPRHTHTYVHIDSNAPVPITMTFTGSGVAQSNLPGTGQQLMSMTTTGVDGTGAGADTVFVSVRGPGGTPVERG